MYRNNQYDPFGYMIGVAVRTVVGACLGYLAFFVFLKTVTVGGQREYFIGPVWTDWAFLFFIFAFIGLIAGRWAWDNRQLVVV